MVDNFTRKINDRCLTRVKLKGSDTRNQKSKVYARKLAQMCGIGIEQAKNSMMASTQNSIRGLRIPLTKQLRTRQAMFRFQWFRGTTYTNIMVGGVKYAYGDRVAQVYVTYFGDVRIYPVAHRRESNTWLSFYFMDSDVPKIYTQKTPDYR